VGVVFIVRFLSISIATVLEDNGSSFIGLEGFVQSRKSVGLNFVPQVNVVR
jgi:hypothetical protein